MGADLVQPRACRLRRPGGAPGARPPTAVLRRGTRSYSPPRRWRAASRPPLSCSSRAAASRRPGRRSWSRRPSSCSPGSRDRSRAPRTCGRVRACSGRHSAPRSAASSRSSPAGRRSSSPRRRSRCSRCSLSGACRCRRPSAVAPAGRPHVGANLALLLGSAALSAALFLLVILLVNGWSIDPAAAGLIVTLMPLAAIAAGRLAPAVESRVVRAVAGFVLIAGGLAALGLLPHAGWGWTVAPQLLVGAGLGLTVAALTEQALAGRAHQAVHGGWTIASRHAGIVLGLVVLTPVFTHELARNQEEATRAGAAIVLDSSIEPLHKLGVAQEVLRTIDAADGRLPDIRPAFAADEDGCRRRRAAARRQRAAGAARARGHERLRAAVPDRLALRARRSRQPSP